MKNIKTFESFVKELTTSSDDLNEAGRPGIPKMFLKLGAVVKKIRELEDKQLELLKPWKEAKEAGDKEAMATQMELMQKNQKELNSYRENKAKIEANYTNNTEMPWDKE
jgi:hypothetical protein